MQNNYAQMSLFDTYIEYIYNCTVATSSNLIEVCQVL
jgi:hypothetical protein